MTILQVALAVVVATAMASSQAADGAQDALISYLNTLNSFSAHFEQQRFDEDGERLDTSSGECQIKRPGRFRWSYAEPYPQLIVSDGTMLWIYDRDLEQVTQNEIGEHAAHSPAALLGQETDVAQHYWISALPAGEDGIAWFALRPRATATDFSTVEIAFADGEVRGMRLKDNLGQITALIFSEITRNVPIDDGQFMFEPPPGIDVIRGAAP